MNFEPNEEQVMLLDNLRRYLNAELRPIMTKYADDTMPKEVVGQVFRQLSQFGIGSGWTPESSGGYGLDLITSGLLYEELSRVSTGVAAGVCVNDAVSVLLHQQGSEEQKEAYLADLISGRRIASIAVTEPGVGSNPGGIRTRAERDGDMLRISGEKTWITNGDINDVTLLICLVDNMPSLVLVEREDGYVSRPLKKLGQKDGSSAQLFFDDVKVPASRIVGAPGIGMREAARSFERARCMVGIYCTGIGAEALALALDYAKERTQWGKKIGQHQLVQALLAEMATEVDCCRLLSLRALSLIEKGQRCEDAAAMAKWYSSEAVQRVTTAAIQVFGSYGLSPEYPVERLFRDARMMNIPDGTTQIQKLIIGRALTGMNAIA